MYRKIVILTNKKVRGGAYQMNFTIENKENFTLIILPEKLDNSISDILKKKLVELTTSGVKNIVFDMSLSKYCDMSGLSVMLVGNRLCKNSNGLFLLINVHEAIKKLIIIAGIAQFLSIRASLQEAENLIQENVVK